MELSQCGRPDIDILHLVETCGYWLEGVLVLGTGLFGIFGNTLSIVILSRADMRTSFNHLLIVLSIFDTTFTVISILDFSFARGDQTTYTII